MTRAGAPSDGEHTAVGVSLGPQSKTRSSMLPIHLKVSQAGRKIFEAVDLFVALATVKLKDLISEGGAQL